MERSNNYSRRDFLKSISAITGAILFGRFFPQEYEKNPEPKISQWPELDLNDVPEFEREIIKLTPKCEFSTANILQMEVDENGQKVMRDLPVDQSKFNLKYLQLAKISDVWQFVTGKPIGLAWHWFGDTPDYAAVWYPHGTAREYVDIGLCGGRSAHFICGDGEPEVGQDALDKKLAIVQSELTDENGNWVTSAHTLPVDRAPYVNYTQYFVNAFDSLLRKYGFAYPKSTTIMQNFYRGINHRPNVQLLGIEISGSNFENQAYFPSNRKIANVLAVSLGIIKKHNISSPAFNAYGHEELDLNKPDPGKNVIFLLKNLIGLSALTSPDQNLKELVFGPFSLAGKVDKNTAISNYFHFIKDFFTETTGPQSFIDQCLSQFQYPEVLSAIETKLNHPQETPPPQTADQPKTS